MKVIIAGGTGQVGTMLARAFLRDAHEVVVLSRKPVIAPWRIVTWDAQTLGDWTSEIEGADVIINLAGSSVNCRYTPKNRRAILNSRINSTIVVGKAIAQALRPPSIWLQASTATIYAHRYDTPNDELTGILGGAETDAPDSWKFSTEVATAWELALDKALVPQTRKVKLRSAMTMSPDPGGIFDVLIGLVRSGLGGCSADGRQYVSWFHEEDFIRAIYYIIEHHTLEGPINLAAPHPLPNAEFMRILRNAWGIRFGLPASKWMLEIGAIFLRTETELILKSRRVVPSKLTQHGFNFKIPTWPIAARDLCLRWQKQSKQQEKPFIESTSSMALN